MTLDREQYTTAHLELIRRMLWRKLLRGDDYRTGRGGNVNQSIVRTGIRREFAHEVPYKQKEFAQSAIQSQMRIQIMPVRGALNELRLPDMRLKRSANGEAASRGTQAGAHKQG